MARKKAKAMGDDPLAWMDGGEESQAGAARAAPRKAKTPNPGPPADKTAVVRLSPALGIADVAALREQLASTVHDSGEVIIDASDVERLDTAVLQLLSAFMAERRSQDAKLAWHAPSEAFCTGAGLLGLESHLGLSRD